MSCQHAETMLDAYFDGELGLTESIEMESHLSTCARCAALLERNSVLRRSLQQPGVYYDPPSALARAIRMPQGRAIPWRGVAIAASAAALVLFAAWMLLRVSQRPQGVEVVSREVVSSHIRSLQASHLFDIASSDQHTVKPWFNGKLDFAPSVKDLAADGFPLAGGRLDYLADRPVAALVYKRRKHVISLFEWPTQRGSDTKPAASTSRGYHLLRWSAGGLAYWAISDLNANELSQFAAQLRR